MVGFGGGGLVEEGRGDVGGFEEDSGLERWSAGSVVSNADFEPGLCCCIVFLNSPSTPTRLIGVVTLVMHFALYGHDIEVGSEMI